MKNGLLPTLGVLLAILVLFDFIYTRKTYVAIEALPAFYPIIAFALCVAGIIIAIALQPILSRKVDYYAPKTTDDEPYPMKPAKKKGGK